MTASLVKKLREAFDTQDTRLGSYEVYDERLTSYRGEICVGYLLGVHYSAPTDKDFSEGRRFPVRYAEKA